MLSKSRLSTPEYLNLLSGPVWSSLVEHGPSLNFLLWFPQNKESPTKGKKRNLDNSESEDKKKRKKVLYLSLKMPFTYLHIINEKYSEKKLKQMKTKEQYLNSYVKITFKTNKLDINCTLFTYKKNQSRHLY